MAVVLTRKDRTAGELRAVAAKCKDAKAALRMLSIAMVLEGYDRKTAAEVCGMDRQTLRDWGDGRPEFCPVDRIQSGTGGAPAGTTPKGWRVCQTGDREAGRPG